MKRKVFDFIKKTYKWSKICPVWGLNSRPSDFWTRLWDWRAAYCANEASVRWKQTLTMISVGISNSPFTSCFRYWQKKKDLLTQEDLVRERWKEHFQKVLNRPLPANVAMAEGCLFVEGKECLVIDTGRFTVEEVRKMENHQELMALLIFWKRFQTLLQ